MEELEKNETSTQAEENTVSLASAQALADALAKIEAYTPTTWVDNSSPDIDAEHLNKPEQAIKRVTDALNSAVDVIKDLQSQVTKNSGAISDVNNNLSNKADKTSLSSYALKSDLYPSYNRSILFTDLKADVTNKSITITEDGLVQAAAKTQENAGTAFVRLTVNNTVVYEGHSVSGTYRYLWTPIFPVKKGDIIKVTLQTGTTDGQRFVYFYKS